MNQQPKYRRILLKLSGEALANGGSNGILDFAFIDTVAAVLKKCQAVGVEIVTQHSALVRNRELLIIDDRRTCVKRCVLVACGRALT